MHIGMVIGDFYEEDRGSIYCIVLSLADKTLYVVPRYLFTDKYLREKGWSKSRVNKRKQGIGVGDLIDFESNQQLITEFEMRGRIDGPLRQLSVEPTGHLTGAFIASAVISSEKERRFVCPTLPHFEVLESKYRLFLSNVVYKCRITYELDMYNKRNHSIYACKPQIKLKFDQFIYVDSDPETWRELVFQAAWNIERNFTETIHHRYPRMCLPWHESNLVFSSECLILDDNEVFCKHLPNEKCFIGTIIPGDILFVRGRVIGCELRYCRYSKAYIVYKYYPQPEISEGIFEAPWCTSLMITEGNPMESRWNNGAIEFLGYVKLNNVNHFYCNFCIIMIRDPHNVLHGRVELGDANEMYRYEKDHTIGTRVWLRYCAEGVPIKWEIVALHEEEKCKVKHKKFKSIGLRLNRKGFVYCPHVCNFPMQICDEPELRSKVNVGDWFKFEAKFDVPQQCYIIHKVTEVVQRRRFEMLELANQDDVFAFRIPLTENFHATRALLYNKEIGFVQDTNKKITMFMCAWKESHPHNPTVPVWCTENTDPNGRLTPLRVVDIEMPEAKV